MKRSILCILLCIVMLLPTLLSCGGDLPPAPEASGERPAASTATPASDCFESAAPIISCAPVLELSSTGALLAACSNNGYLYYVVYTSNNKAKICCKDLLTDAVLTEGPDCDIGEATSICYNTQSNVLVVATGSTTLSVVDPATLTVVSTHTVKESVKSIAYLGGENCYVVRFANKKTLTLLDTVEFKQFKIVSLPGAAADMTVWDVTADDRYIYALVKETTSMTDAETAGVVVYDTTTKQALKNTFDFDVSDRTLVSLCFNGTSYLVGTSSFTYTDAFWGGAPVPVSGEAIPYNLFARTLQTGVDSIGLSATRLFKVYELSNVLGTHTVMQGGGTDGKYAYFCMEDQKNDYENTLIHTTRLVKVDMETNTLVAVSEPLSLGHSNDLCYNSRTGKLLVVHCGFTSKDTARVSIVDPDTLTVDEVITLPVGTHCMSYDATTDQYIIGKSRNFAILDSEFNVLIPKVNVGSASFCKEDELITQGCDSDSEYVYFVLGGRTAGKPWVNYLVVYDWSGNMVAAKIIPNMTDESENIFHIGNTIYVTCNGSNAPTYRIDITP